MDLDSVASMLSHNMSRFETNSDTHMLELRFRISMENFFTCCIQRNMR